MREKRQREVQFSKAGLELPHAVQPFKKRTINDSACEIEHCSDRIHVAYSNESAKDKEEALNAISISSPSSEGLTVRNEVGTFTGDAEVMVKKVPHDNITLASPQSVQKCPFKCNSDDKDIKKLKV